MAFQAAKLCGLAVIATLIATTVGATEIDPPPLGSGLRPGSVRLPEPRLAPPEPKRPDFQVSPGMNEPKPTPARPGDPYGRRQPVTEGAPPR
jgi:hypothetical protein